ncbi:hypothetical protein VFA_002870 [Vibrio furnissii CIP 102972]|nr:hypothetical protein VFA_002870 [Vibrio furnissii CIP 102972]
MVHSKALKNAKREYTPIDAKKVSSGWRESVIPAARATSFQSDSL